MARQSATWTLISSSRNTGRQGRGASKGTMRRLLPFYSKLPNYSPNANDHQPRGVGHLATSFSISSSSSYHYYEDDISPPAPASANMMTLLRRRLWLLGMRLLGVADRTRRLRARDCGAALLAGHHLADLGLGVRGHGFEEGEGSAYVCVCAFVRGLGWEGSLCVCVCVCLGECACLGIVVVSPRRGKACYLPPHPL